MKRHHDQDNLQKKQFKVIGEWNSSFKGSEYMTLTAGSIKASRQALWPAAKIQDPQGGITASRQSSTAAAQKSSARPQMQGLESKLRMSLAF